jgi:outer membrane lipopolysaccharide assembly protein LptE/RlpB
VEIKIGIQSAPRELTLETESSQEELERRLRDALADGGVFVVADVKGGKAVVPADKIAYLEFGSSEPRRVGFSSS